MNFKIFLKSIGDIDEDLLIDIYYMMAKNYFYCKQIEECYVYLDDILMRTKNDCIVAKTLLLKSEVLMAEQKMLEAQQVLEKMIGQSKYSSCLSRAYLYLSYNFKKQKLYQFALDVLREGRNHFDNELDLASAYFMMGNIYYKLGDYVQCDYYYRLSRMKLLIKGNYKTKKNVIKHLLGFYFALVDLTGIEALIEDIKQIDAKETQSKVEVYLKLQIYKHLMENNTKPTEKIKQYILDI